MQFSGLMTDQQSHLSFEGIEELKSRELQLRLFFNKSENETDLLIYPHPDSQVQTLQVDFPNYIAYSVVYDDYTSMNDYELYEGHAFRIYQRPHFRDFILKGYLPQEKTPVHYAFMCFEHVVHVMAYEEPLITEILNRP